MRNLIGGAIVLMVLSMAAAVPAEEKITTLDEIIVTAKKLVKPTKQTNDTVYTGSEVTKEGIEVQGTKATVSVYEAVNVLPGVSVETIDPTGLAAEQKNIRIRGVRGYLGALTVAGVPNYGGNPMGPRDYLYDMENIDGIAVYRGAVPADLGTGVGSRGGAIELRPRWPEERPGADISQGFGENDYMRTFLRVDSGALPWTGTRLSVSGSFADAQKWKGPGDLGPRENASVMLSQPIANGDPIQFWFNYNDLEQNLYKPLTYGQTQDLDANYDNDYNPTLTGVAARDVDYFDYNRGDYLNRDFLALLPLRFSDRFDLMFKPYYSAEKTEILAGTMAMGGSIQKRFRDITRYGLISKFDAQFSRATASVGYWYESSDMIIRQSFYNAATFDFRGYGMLMENDGDGIVQSPYVKLAGQVGRFDWQAGLKYFHYTDPASQGYIAAPPDYAVIRAPDLVRQEKTYDALLPTLGVDYRISDGIEFYTSYGRNQIRPYAYMPLITTYNANRADFQAAGVTLDELFDGYDMEISDSVELGARFFGSRVEILPTFFYAKHKNLLTTVHDPRIGANGVNYFQNVGKATAYGVELETNFFLGEHATFFFNPTYTSLTYDGDLTFAGATLDTKDNQVVDTPEWMLKSGLMLTFGDFELVPMLRYLGERYGDAENTEKIGDYTTVDLKIGYTQKHLAFIDRLNVSLELINLFDKEYVSVINAMDDSRAGATSYYVGAPFTTLLTLSLDI